MLSLILDFIGLFSTFNTSGLNHKTAIALLSHEQKLNELPSDEYFAQVKVNPELGTIQLPNGADLDPDVLYAARSVER